MVGSPSRAVSSPAQPAPEVSSSVQSLEDVAKEAFLQSQAAAKAAFRQFFRNHAYFLSHLSDIKEQYGEKTYVVIREEDVIDSGKDKQALCKTYKGQRVYINAVANAHRTLRYSPTISAH